MLHSSHSHTSTKPRVRIIIPLATEIHADIYEAVARKVAWLIENTMEIFDVTCFRHYQYMYYPSCSSDAEPVYVWAGRDNVNIPLLDPIELIREDESLLSMDKSLYKQKNSENLSGLAVDTAVLREKTRPENLREGTPQRAFCLAYDIETAIAEFLPDIYIDGGNGRYTYKEGTGAKGAVIYENGSFLYSNHATDPASGKLLNAYELVQVHRFGDLDGDVVSLSPKSKSSKAMRDWLTSNDEALAEFYKVRLSEMQTIKMPDGTMLKVESGSAVGDFAELVSESVSNAVESAVAEKPLIGPGGWITDYEMDKRGKLVINGSFENCELIFEHDPLLEGRIATNVYTGLREFKGNLPSSYGDRLAKGADAEKWRCLTDGDEAGLIGYFEKQYGITNRNNIRGALDSALNAHRRDEIVEFLDSLPEWDGVPRADALFIDYLGAEDSEYTRQITRKTLLACIKRAYVPGIKFDQMLVIYGEQGTGKSTILAKLAINDDWFTDSVETFEGKESAERIQGKWIVEVGELSAFRRTKDAARIKQFLSTRVDTYRAAYARNAENRPRKCVIFGTTNEREFLKDFTGNRRFWIVDGGKQTPKYSIFTDLTEDIVKAIWAEMIHAHKHTDEGLEPSAEVLKELEKVQESHIEEDTFTDSITDYINTPVPKDFRLIRTRAERSSYFALYNAACEDESGKLMEELVKQYGELSVENREYVCVQEIWEEALNGAGKDIDALTRRRIGGVLRQLGWDFYGKMLIKAFGKSVKKVYAPKAKKE